MTEQDAKVILQPGVHFRVPGNSSRSSISGTVLKVNRVNFTYRTYYFEQEMILTHPIRDIHGIQAVSLWPRKPIKSEKEASL